MTKITEIEYESSYKELTDRGTLTLPRNIKSFDKYKVKETFRRGDKVLIYWGYDRNLNLEFTGYITEVSADIPIVIKFEDEMFNIKKIPVNFSSRNVTLDNLLKSICPGYKIEALEGVQLGAVRLSKTQLGAVLDKLKQQWGIYSYYKNETLYSGKYVSVDNGKALFDLERNCVSQALNYKNKEDVILKIKCVSVLKNGKKIEVIVGDQTDKNAYERQLTFYNIEVKAELEKLGNIEYEKYKVDRFDGDFTSFGIPSVRHGMKCELISTLYPDRNGTYYIEKVVKSFSIEGIRQIITIGEKVANGV